MRLTSDDLSLLERWKSMQKKTDAPLTTQPSSTVSVGQITQTFTSVTNASSHLQNSNPPQQEIMQLQEVTINHTTNPLATQNHAPIYQVPSFHPNTSPEANHTKTDVNFTPLLTKDQQRVSESNTGVHNTVPNNPPSYSEAVLAKNRIGNPLSVGTHSKSVSLPFTSYPTETKHQPQTPQIVFGNQQASNIVPLPPNIIDTSIMTSHSGLVHPSLQNASKSSLHNDPVSKHQQLLQTASTRQLQHPNTSDALQQASETLPQASQADHVLKTATDKSFLTSAVGNSFLSSKPPVGSHFGANADISDFMSLLSNEPERSKMDDLTLVNTPKGTGAGYGVGLNLDDILAQSTHQSVGENRYFFLYLQRSSRNAVTNCIKLKQCSIIFPLPMGFKCHK